MDEEGEKVTESRGLVGILFRGVPIPLVIVLLVIILIAAGVYGVRVRPEVFGLSKGQAQLQQEVDRLVELVGSLIALPEDEEPTVATVTDVEAVRDQPFFDKAQNGDKVLIYTNARKAILYRPSENRILEVGLVNINQENTEEVEGESIEEEAEATPTPTPTPTPEEEEETSEEVTSEEEE